MAQITLQTVEQAHSEKAGNFYRVKADGVEYSCFEPSLYPLLKVGATIEAEITVKGKYKNIVSATLVSSAPVKPETVQQQGETAHYESIERRTCLEAAVELWGEAEPAGRDTMAILRSAELFYQWVSGALHIEPYAVPVDLPVPPVEALFPDAQEPKPAPITMEQRAEIQKLAKGRAITDGQLDAWCQSKEWGESVAQLTYEQAAGLIASLKLPPKAKAQKTETMTEG